MIATNKDNDDDNYGDGATGNEVDNNGDGTTGDGATGYDNNNNNGGGPMGDEVGDYGKGATGNDDNDDNNDNDNNGDGTERRNNQIEAMAVVGGNNSHRCSMAESDNDEDDDNRSRQDCATRMWALCRGTSTITTTPMQRRSQAGLRQQC